MYIYHIYTHTESPYIFIYFYTAHIYTHTHTLFLMIISSFLQYKPSKPKKKKKKTIFRLLYIILYIVYTTGMRCGELFALAFTSPIGLTI